jgi:hypothetical protein
MVLKIFTSDIDVYVEADNSCADDDLTNEFLTTFGDL